MKKPSESEIAPSNTAIDDEINLLEYWAIIKKHRKFIIRLVIICAFSTAVLSLFMTNIYESTAVIAPVEAPSGLSSLASQFGGIASLAGISLPGSSSLSELENYLKSNVVREKAIEDYHLMPIIFSDGWDAEKKEWKKPSFFAKLASETVGRIRSLLMPTSGKTEKIGEGPTMWDGLRKLNDIFAVKADTKNNMITIAADMKNPESAALVVNDLLTALTDHMSNEARRTATINRKYLEEQLKNTVDPVVRQNIYTMLSQQIQTALMAEAKANFAFKVIDPPKVPDRKKRPKRSLLVILSIILSGFIGIFVAFFREYLGRVKAEQAAQPDVDQESVSD